MPELLEKVLRCLNGIDFPLSRETGLFLDRFLRTMGCKKSSRQRPKSWGAFCEKLAAGSKSSAAAELLEKPLARFFGGQILLTRSRTAGARRRLK